MSENLESTERVSALAQAGLSGAARRGRHALLTERPAVSIVRLHSLSNLDEEGSSLFDLPDSTGSVLGGDPAALCLRPREWLLVSDTAPADLLRGIQAATDPSTTVATDQSDGMAVFRLTGIGSPWLLSKLSSLDFARGVERSPHCARTRMGNVPVLVHYLGREDDAPSFDLFVDRSLARYLWERLTDSMPHADELADRSGATP